VGATFRGRGGTAAAPRAVDLSLPGGDLGVRLRVTPVARRKPHLFAQTKQEDIAATPLQLVAFPE